MPRVLPFLVLLLLGPKEALAGKFPGSDALSRLVEAGHGTAAVFEALGDALLARGDGALAYRAYHKAQALADAASRTRIQGKRDRCPYVDPQVIAEEERQARAWVGWLQEYERDRIRRGEDPRDLKPFYERYGRAEDDLREVARARRTTWALAVAAGLLGAAAILGAVLFLGKRRRA